MRAETAKFAPLLGGECPCRSLPYCLKFVPSQEYVNSVHFPIGTSPAVLCNQAELLRAAPAITSGISSATGPPTPVWDTSGNGDRWDREVSSRRELCRASDTTETASPVWRASAPIETGNPPGPAPTLPRCTCSACDPPPPSLG